MANNLSIFNFKPYKKAFIAACITFVCLNLLLAFFMRQYDGQSETGRSISDGRYNSMRSDVLFLGDSRVHEGLDPEIFAAESAKTGGKLEAVNMGAPGMQGPFYYLILKEYIEHAVNVPKVVVADISFYLLGGDQWLRDVYIAYYTPDIMQVWELKKSRLLKPAEAVDWYVGTRIPALRYNKAFSGLIDSFSADPQNGIAKHYADAVISNTRTNDLSLRGYFTRGTTTTADGDLARWDPDKEYRIGIEKGYSVYFDYFKKFFELAAHNKIHVIIYTSPWQDKARNNKNFHEVYDYYDHMLKDLAKDNPYVHFVEFDYFWPQPLFADILHLNQKGAEKLTKMVVGWVRELKVFPVDRAK